MSAPDPAHPPDDERDWCEAGDECVSGAPPGPSAGSITVAETLDLLEGPFVALARGVTDWRYALWLGFGISRERLPDIGQLILKVLEFLHGRAVGGFFVLGRGQRMVSNTGRQPERRVL